MAWYKTRIKLPKVHPLQLKKCPKHNVWYCWKHELKDYPFRKYLNNYKPVRVCPVCIKLDRLKIWRLIADFYLGSTLFGHGFGLSREFKSRIIQEKSKSLGG